MSKVSFKASAKITSILALAILLSSPFAAYASSNTNVAKGLPTPLVVYKCSDCMAGWGVAGSSLTSVSANLDAPTITCSSSHSYEGVDFIVGIDTDPSTAAQAGVSAFCVGGSLGYYIAYWYNAITNQLVESTWSVSPGDTVTMSIKAVSGNFDFSVKDGTNSLTGSASDSGAEFIHTGCFSAMYTDTALAKFSPASYTNCLVDKTGVGKTSQTLVEWVCYNSGGTKILMEPSSLSGANSDDFTVNWKASGP